MNGIIRSGGTLEKIARYKLDEVAHRRAALSEAALDQALSEQSPPRGFIEALRRDHALHRRPALIAEIKKASPSKGVIRKDFDPRAHAVAYEAGGAACLSVLTDSPSFQGADSYLVEAREAVALPALRKDFLVDPWQVRESRALGADCILIIMAMLEDALARDLFQQAEALGIDALIEVHDAMELERALALSPQMIGVNNRDLRHFSVDLSVTETLAAQVSDEVLLVSESGLFTASDIARVARCGARAVLVGESLMRQSDLKAATRALMALG